MKGMGMGGMGMNGMGMGMGGMRPMQQYDMVRLLWT